MYQLTLYMAVFARFIGLIHHLLPTAPPLQLPAMQCNEY